MSGMPPARTATTGTPLDIASSTTNPSVSVSLGMANTSPEAYAALSSSPWSIPINLVGVPSKCCSSSARTGPSPTMARRYPGSIASTPLSASMFFSAPRRPTCTMTGDSGCPSVSRARISAEQNLGWNTSLSTPRFHTWIDSCGATSSSFSSCCSTADVTSVRSAAECSIRIIPQTGRTIHLKVYRGTYFGMCVWYDNTSGLRSIFE
mmetsp:Transcript_1176/g.4411  ORF Transcript_1176/g.4411 Transcript_1176/m.4411 type:complete len:207 (+) Transcript_1176:520-1140(+)